MATIKDVAALAGVSTATVSLVLNGRGQELKVSAATQQKVLAAAKTLAYKPNASARKLRTSEVEKPTIAFYWPMDLRINYLAAILTGLRTEIEKLQFDCELIICTYRNDYLAEEQGLKNAYRYSAAIIGAPSEADMAYLQGLKTSLPIILFNRYLEKYHTVCSQDESTLRNAVNLLAAKGHVRACLFHPDALYTVSGKRLSMLLQFAEETGLSIERNSIFSVEDSCDGGVIAARRYLSLDHPPKAILSMSDTIAIGASSILSRKGLVMPEDVELIAFAIGDPNLSHFANPSLSVIEMPSHEMAENCIDIARQVIQTPDLPLCHRQIPSKLILRESCPE